MRTVVAVLALVASLMVATAARADFGLRLTTLDVRVGGVLRGHGNGGGMPVYLVPADRAPRLYRCQTPRGTSYCYRRSQRPPGRPYILLGRMPRDTTSTFAPRPFTFRVPAVTEGRYGVVLWCKSCGGSLFLAGESARSFQTVAIRR